MKYLYVKFRPVFCVVVLTALWSCSAEIDSETQFRNTLTIMEKAIENRHIDTFMDYIDPDYSDSQSRDRLDVQRIAQLHVLRNKNLHLFKHITELNLIEEESAYLEILVAIAAKPIESAESLISMRAELMQFQVSFQYQDDFWKVISAEWSRASANDFF